MKTITVCKASPNPGETIEGMTLVVDGEMEDIDGDDWELRSKARFAHEAFLVDEALSVLPMGTRHALLVRMLERQRMLYVVSDRKPDVETYEKTWAGQRDKAADNFEAFARALPWWLAPLRYAAEREAAWLRAMSLADDRTRRRPLSLPKKWADAILAKGKTVVQRRA